MLGRAPTALAAAVLLLLSSAGAHASDPTKQQCVAFNERGQSLREQHRLRAAREQFVACQSPSCPNAVREDCADAVQKLDKALPSFLFSVRDSDGSTLKSVAMRIDGQALTQLIEGSALTVDPGEHEVTFEVAGYVAKTLSLHAQEDGRQQRVVISLERSAEAKSPVVSSPSILKTDSPAPETSTSPSPRRLLTYAVAGGGLVAFGLGTAFGISAKVKYDDATSPSRCPGGPPACDALGVDGVQSADSAAKASTIFFIVGGLLAGAAAVLWLSEPSIDGSRALQPGTWHW